MRQCSRVTAMNYSDDESPIPIRAAPLSRRVKCAVYIVASLFGAFYVAMWCMMVVASKNSSDFRKEHHCLPVEHHKEGFDADGKLYPQPITIFKCDDGKLYPWPME